MTRVTVIPGLQDINVYDSLDERCAVKNFLGKNLGEAEAMIRDSPHVFEDFSHMGPKAFCYYIQAFLSYLKSDASMEDSESAYSFCCTLECRLESDAEEIASALPVLMDGVQFMIEHADKFKDGVEIDPDAVLDAIRKLQFEYQSDDEILAQLDIPSRLTKLKSRLELLVNAS